MTNRNKGIRIQVLSDIHTEFGSYAEPSPRDLATDADVVVLAGDIAHAPDAVAVAARLFPAVPVIMVAGNHEHYGTGRTIDQDIGTMRDAAARVSIGRPPIHVLEDEEVVLDIHGVPVLFLGCTLWTDFALFGDPVLDRVAVEMGMNDFGAIKGRRIDPLGLYLGRGATSFKTAEWLERHDASAEFLRSRLVVSHDGPTVVVTHHLPSMRSVMPRYQTNHLSAGFASNLDDIVDQGAALWVHGHTHGSCEWRADGGTLVVCNPAGYARRMWRGQVVRENADFVPRFVVDIRRSRGGLWRAERD